MTKQQKDTNLKKKLEEAKKQAEFKDRQEQQKAETPQISELEKVKQEFEQMTELAKRTMADLQNLKRRQEEERTQIFTMALSDIIIQILPILDNLERARQHTPPEIQKTAKEWYEGIEISINQLHQILNNAGLIPIQSLNQPFNPELHEAIVQGPGEKDIIIEELEKGYMLGNRVLRHAKVKVGNGEKT